MRTIKFIQVSDFHFDARDAERGVLCGRSVENAAQEHGADFILSAGDWWHRPHLATEADGIRTALDIMRSWLKATPVAGIYGTPSHEAPGSLAVFQELGFQVLNPGVTYWYKTGRIASFETWLSESKPFPDAILFGIPELSKNNIQAQLGLPAEQANAATEALFYQYIEEFVAPNRLKYDDIPAIGVIHGNFTDARRENTTDIILKASDILLHTEQMQVANLDWWAAGHIHQPSRFQNIPGGYAGSPGIAWGERDFVPAMELVEISDAGTSVTRIPYGTPERKKIYAPLAEYDPQVAYWLVTDDPDAVVGGHPISRITHTVRETTTRRITGEQASTVKSLEDLFLLFDPPNVTPAIIDKIKTITREIPPPDRTPVDVRVKSVSVTGAVFWGGKSVSLDIADLPDGLNAISADNGAGKSSVLAFCSPYPVVIGKDTKSGRDSAIKDFFDQPESSIEKIITVNGQTHRHLITIKAAHTKTPKTECYLFVDDKNILAVNTFDAMFAKCEELYGPLADYLLTTFYVQPLQSKSGSSLMSAGVTEARNLVQTIAGIDRDREKRFALDRVQSVTREAEAKQVEIKTLTAGLDDEQVIRDKISEAEKTSESARSKMAQAQAEGERLKSVLADLRIKKEKNDEQRRNQGRRAELERQIHALESEIQNLAELASSLEVNRARLETISEQKLQHTEREREILAVRERNAERTSKHNELITKITAEHQKQIDEYNRLYSEYSRLKNERDRIEAMKNPCPNCGYIPPEFDVVIEVPVEPVRPTSPVNPPSPELEPLPRNTVVVEDDSQVRRAIESGVAAEAGIAANRKSISAIEQEISGIVISDIIPGVQDRIFETETDLDDKRREYSEYQTQAATADQDAKHARDQLARLEENRAKIVQRETELATLSADIKDWQYIAAMLQASKIPAMELEIVLDAIDSEATANVEPFLDGRFSIRTSTQNDNGADKFDIIIHDNETGSDQSFFTKNPGHKAFFNDAYIKALIHARNERLRRSYSPIVYDEADAPIQPSRIPMYYQMQEVYFRDQDTKVLIVSQKENALTYVQSKIMLEEIKK